MLKLYPHADLGSIYQPDAVFLPRPSFHPYGNIEGAALHYDRRLCSTLPLYAAQKVIVPEGVMHPVCLDLLARSGIVPLPESQCLVYQNRKSFEARLDAAGPGSLLVDHPHPLHGLDPEKYRIPRDLLVRMIDKVHLGDWVPARLLPPRQVLDRRNLHEADSSLWQGGEGCLLKTTGPYPTGGGYGIESVGHREDLFAAAAKIPGTDPLVLESRLPHQKSYCVNLLFPETGDRSPFLLGVAEQWIGVNSRFVGSRLYPISRIPSAILEAAAEVAVQVRETPYVGVMGLDILDTRWGPRVVDLNPRTNFSTAPLFQMRRLHQLYGTERSYVALNARISRKQEEEALGFLRREVSDRRIWVYRAYHDLPGTEVSLYLGILLPESAASSPGHFDQMRAQGMDVSI